MKNIKNIIGANYGDEGKGLITRYFAIKEKNPIIILYHGSVNRGSLIEKNDVFCASLSTFGAGVLDNIPTFLAENFIISPMRFSKEYVCLLDWNLPIGITYVDPKCQVITPIDIILDKIRWEYLKEQGISVSSCCAGNRSCAMRSKINNLNFTYQDFLNGNPIEICNYIFDNWFYTGLEQLGVKKIPVSFLNYKTRNSGIIDGFYEQFLCFDKSLKIFNKNTILSNFDYIYNNFDTLIFEGSVGLKLSIENKDQINATYSTVGMKETMNLLKNYNDYKGEACYVTRSYLTRHGGGFFPEEYTNNELKNFEFIDNSNKDNTFQGKMRFGELNYKEFFNRCNNDFYNNANTNWILTRAITHINEIPVDPFLKYTFNYFSNTRFAEDVYDRNTYNNTL